MSTFEWIRRFVADHRNPAPGLRQVQGTRQRVPLGGLPGNTWFVVEALPLRQYLSN